MKKSSKKNSTARDSRFASRIENLQHSKLRQARSSPLPATGPGDREIIDLASGSPTEDTPAILKDLAIESIQGGENQYSHQWGNGRLRELIAAESSYALAAAKHTPQKSIDAESQVTITGGTSSALAAVCLALLGPGDEAIVFEPLYEGGLNSIRLAGAEIIPVSLQFRSNSWRIDWKMLESRITSKTRAVFINSPANPTGKIFSLAELERLTQICRSAGAVLVSDEIYSRMVFQEKAFHSALAGGGAHDCCIVVDGLSKAYNVTGWRLANIIAPASISDGIRKVVSALGCMAPTPFQVAAAKALSSENPEYRQSLESDLQERLTKMQTNRDRLVFALRRAGFRLARPHGGSFLYADAACLARGMSDKDILWQDSHFWRDLLLQNSGILASPGSWCQAGVKPSSWLRFCLAREQEIIEEASSRLLELKSC